ncbi:hypothetical protein MMP64_20075 [Acinetobacter sp. ANC 5659]|uniref:hypothetical protein n=1 Tax=Acinetobacter higginsii TaxID=70347 RepID=UPI0002CFBE95|nr:hypothetical protein [Acinetobacter higginsii]ENX58635.1 hypothetical protein F885_03012 [Acinetobacter higginsii]MCH7320223.1 hypothetical protein [Acinetobacter higginsii]
MKDPKDNKTIDVFKPEPKTSAERQRAYRERNSDAGDTRRLDTVISSECYFALKEISKLEGETMRQSLERIIKEASDRTPGALARMFGFKEV